MAALHDHQWLGTTGVAGRFEVPKGSVSDELLIRALQPLKLVQIGLQHQLFAGFRGQVKVHRIRSLEQALGLLAAEEFDAIVLGPDLPDAWPTTAYERLAESADTTPVVVEAESMEAMIIVKQRQARTDDTILSSAAPILVVERVALAAVLRHRTLAAAGTEIG